MATYGCLFVTICFLTVIYQITCKTVFISPLLISAEERAFMQRYGYLLKGDDEDGDFAYSMHAVSEAVMKLQAFAGLPQSGVLDPETKKLFRKKRCGVKDVQTNRSREKRYTIQSGWTKRVITYRVLNSASTLDQHHVETLMAKALAVWAPHGGLRFEPLQDGHADIQVSFVRGDHGDGSPFDGAGRVVAHAFPPPLGAMHFDDDEIWGDNAEDDEDDVTDFFAVAVHEIGHALGLSHSNVRSSVMYPYYQVPVENLHMDDILGMHELYLSDGSVDFTENPLPASSMAPQFTKADEEDVDDDVPDLCYANYDTIQVLQEKIFVFEEQWVWVLSKRKQVEPGYPKKFHDVFVGLPRNFTLIRTIYEKQNGNIVIFENRNYWEFDSNFYLIKNGTLSDYKLPNAVQELSTVFLSNYNNKTYLIDYERFWRYDEATQTMDRRYPKDMSAWRQLPYPVDAAIIWEGDTFFFRGPRFWRFDNELVRAHEYYPLPTAQIWFPCNDTEEMNRYVTNDGTVN